MSTGQQAFMGDTGEYIYRAKLDRAVVGLQASSVAEEVEAEGEPDSAMAVTTSDQESTNARGRTAPKNTHIVILAFNHDRRAWLCPFFRAESAKARQVVEHRT